jgi:hypothetical protein
MHLRDTDLLGDLSLSQLPEKAQGENRPFSRSKLGQQRAQRLAIVD